MSVEVSVIIISFNTRKLLEDCLKNVIENTKALSAEIIVFDNASKDGSAEMVADAFPQAVLIRSAANLGFGPANNAAFNFAKGRYFCLLNSDALLHPGALEKALDHIKGDPKIGMGGARLVGADGSWQPSARLFPSFLNEFLQLSGLASKYPHSRFFGRFNRTWASPDQSCMVDWVPGAFALIPQCVLRAMNGFDERFFLYYEEVDLCKRIKASGFKVAYWGDVVVTHLGGESSKTIIGQTFSKKESQLLLWRMRSELLYFRKHQGWLGAYSIKSLEIMWHHLRAIKNGDHPEKSEESRTIVRLMRQAWKETQGGAVCPPLPWS